MNTRFSAWLWPLNLSSVFKTSYGVGLKISRGSSCLLMFITNFIKEYKDTQTGTFLSLTDILCFIIVV